MKMLNAGFGAITGIVTKVIGGQMLRDVQTFISAMDTMFGGFRERADYTFRLLRAPGTAFLVIAAPEPDALREASYFVERLAEERMPLAGLVLNRVHRSPAPGLSAARSLAAAEMLQAAGPAGRAASGNGGLDEPAGQVNGEPGTVSGAAEGRRNGGQHALAIAALRLHSERMQLVASERRLAERFTGAHPLVPIAEIAAQPEDVHDLAGLRAIGRSFGG
jgi:anion-transporting  ArsA/GET3 family ATPase